MKRVIKALLFTLFLGITISFSPAEASLSVTSGLLVSLDSISPSNFSGTTWYGQDGTNKNATLQTSAQYVSASKYVTMTDVNSSPSYAVLDAGNGAMVDSATTNGDMTVEVWALINNVKTSSWNIFATRWFGGLNTNNSCGSGSSDFHFGLKYGYPNLYLTGSAAQNITNSNYTISNGTWHQYAFTVINPSNRNGSGGIDSGTATLYLDGAAIASVSGANVYHFANQTCYFILGDSRQISVSGLGIDGAMEKFRLYNKALTADEISKNYRADAQNVLHTLPAGPYNSVAPSISGTQIVTTFETSTIGTWLNTPTSYTYQWSRSATSNGTYTDITGATGQTYQTVAGDVGYFLKVTVSATNSSGTFTAASVATTAILSPNVILTFASANQIPIYRTTNNLTASTGSVAGKITFAINGKAIPGCKGKIVNGGNSFTAVCPWKPATHSSVKIIATFTPSDAGYNGTVGSISLVPAKARTNNR